MKCKAFEAIVELDVQAVSCPGVWLCPNGKVTAHFYMFDSCTQTQGLEPIFPLIYQETFNFRKIFSNVRTLTELDKSLGSEILYVELIQWENVEKGNILATFETPLTDLLYPEFEYKCIFPGVDVDLLMRTTRYFPGIIGPKVEMITKTVIKEVFCSCRNDRKKVALNPKVISSKCCPQKRLPLRQQRVCHSSEYHNAHINRKSKKAGANDEEYNFSLPRSPRYAQKECKCNEMRPVSNKNDYRQEQQVQKINQPSFVTGSECLCHLKSTRILCPLCTKYKYYFEKPCGCIENSNLWCDCKMRKHFQRDEIRDSAVDKKKVAKKMKRSQCERKRQTFAEKSESIHYDEYQSQVKPSLATKIHSRLEKALETNDDCVYDHSPIDSPLRENSNRDSNHESCKGTFYKNLREFYDELHNRARHMSSYEIGKDKVFNI